MFTNRNTENRGAPERPTVVKPASYRCRRSRAPLFSRVPGCERLSLVDGKGPRLLGKSVSTRSGPGHRSRTVTPHGPRLPSVGPTRPGMHHGLEGQPRDDAGPEPQKRGQRVRHIRRHGDDAAVVCGRRSADVAPPRRVGQAIEGICPGGRGRERPPRLRTSSARRLAGRPASRSSSSPHGSDGRSREPREV